MSLMFNGNGVSRGFAIGEIYILHKSQSIAPEQNLEKRAVGAEIKRFRKALRLAKEQLNATLEIISSDSSTDVVAFIEMHIMMLDDTSLTSRPEELIKERLMNAEWALKVQRKKLVSAFEAMDDPYLRARKDDVNQVIDRILDSLSNSAPKLSKDSNAWKGKIVVANDLSPADTVIMRHQGVAGFVTEIGGHLSHTAILARSLGIPAVVGVKDAMRYLVDGEEALIDGKLGMILVNVRNTEIVQFKKKQRELNRKKKELSKLNDAPAKSACGKTIKLRANIEIEDDLRALKKYNNDGVGLYRTEFMYIDQQNDPDEDLHYRNYVKVIRVLKGAPLTIRTVDMGSDKTFDKNRSAVNTLNPALGLRGIRRSLNEPSQFTAQLRAILRAGTKGPVQILLPMISTLDEIHQIKSLITLIQQSFDEEGISYAKNIPLGAMIEVPSAAINADLFAKKLDFLSIGTNDLIQYSLAIDRIDDQVNYLYDPVNPAVLRLIKQTIDAGKKAKIPVSLCGDMASDPSFTPLLLGLGLREFSMPVNSILEVKNALRKTNIKSLKELSEAMLDSYSTEQQMESLQQLNAHLTLN